MTEWEEQRAKTEALYQENAAKMVIAFVQRARLTINKSGGNVERKFAEFFEYELPDRIKRFQAIGTFTHDSLYGDMLAAIVYRTATGSTLKETLLILQGMIPMLPGPGIRPYETGDKH